MIATGISFSSDGRRVHMWEVEVPIGLAPRDAIEQSCENCKGTIHLGDLTFHVRQDPCPEGVPPETITRDDWRKILKEYGVL